jgi:hypothetical protein
VQVQYGYRKPQGSHSRVRGTWGWPSVGLWKALPALPWGARHCGQPESPYDLGGKIDMGQRALRALRAEDIQAWPCYFFSRRHRRAR